MSDQPKGIRVNEINLFTTEVLGEDRIKGLLNTLSNTRGFQIEETNPFSKDKYDPSLYEGIETAFFSGEKLIFLDREDSDGKVFSEYLSMTVNSDYSDEVSGELSSVFPSGVNQEGWNEENWIYQMVVNLGKNTYPVKESISPKNGLRVDYKIDTYTRNNEQVPEGVFSVFEFKIFTGDPNATL